MLYPREDKNQQMLLFACRNCRYVEVAETPCVYSNKIAKGLEYIYVHIHICVYRCIYICVYMYK